MDESQHFLDISSPHGLIKARSATLTKWNLSQTVSAPRLRVISGNKESTSLYRYAMLEQGRIEHSERLTFAALALCGLVEIICAFA